MSMPTTLTPPAATGRRGYPGSVLRDDPYTRMRHQDLLDRAPRYQQTAITAPTVADTPYGPWPDLIRDVFGAHHAPEQPVVLDQDDVRGDRALHRDIITALTASDGFHAARALTRDRPLEAAIATMATAEHLAGDIEGRLAQAAKAAQAAQEARERYERALDTGEGHEQITALHQEATDMQAAAQDAARTAAAEAAEAAKDATGGAVEKVRAISTIPGLGPGERHRLSPDQQLTLAQEWTGNPALSRIARLAGRLRRDMTAARSRARTTQHTPIRPRLGDDLAHLAAEELVAIRHPRLRRDFIARLCEQQVTCWQMHGDDRTARGPLVILTDSSGSMAGARREWAMALAIASIQIAHKDRRDACVIDYASTREQEVYQYPHRARTRDFTPMAASFLDGGTDITAALGAAEGVIRNAPAFTHADIVLITDGNAPWNPQAQAQHQRLTDMAVRVHTIAVATGSGEYLARVSTTLTHTTDMELTSPNTAARSIAAAAL